ncbi:MAG: hypothetical protein WCK34_13805, partial [Bacteroidota bacterium]
LAISDSFELAAVNTEALENAVKSFPGYRTITPEGEKLLVYFDEPVNPGELNRHLFGQGVTLTHLSERKRTLEQHFLELLRDNA